MIRSFEALDIAASILTNKMFELLCAQRLFKFARISEIFPVIFVIEILGEPDRSGNATVIERRTHTGPTVTEALRTARANLRSPPPSAYSFSMKANGKEVGRWQRGDVGGRADVSADIETARSRSHPEDDEY
jgi:hypothetical protein